MSISTTAIENFIKDYFPNYHKNGDEINFNSPFYNDTKQRLYVNLKSKVFFDQKMQDGGSFPKFVADYLNISYQDACKILESDYQSYDDIKNLIDIRDIITDKKEIEIEEKASVKDPLDIHPKLFDDYDELDEDRELALRYLRDRKIDFHGLGYFNISDKDYGGRIFIPFYENEELVFFLARSYIGSSLRYKNPPLKTDYIFNYDNIKEDLVIFEGVFDALSLDNMVGTAILSNRLKEEQARKIMEIKTIKNIIIVPDKDENIETRKLILNNLIYNYTLLNKYKRISRKVNFYIYDIPGEYKDFNEYKVKTGNGNIKLEDCSPFDKSTVILRTARLGLEK